ncbi:MAG TPA: RsmE family RNA methyltransferase [Candidatus Cloacimonas sp.]|jgi:16S rRNA (uracil1498-N3)-methyltransferase|nr:16S rRNA (uracil(1498)-N(3))-methyltransferase [Candidatus Cloacimonas sp.]MDD2250741.1 RsmE family RNA methyltransferase [Candidatus Cloacimonadota bacterium]MDD3734748.1 RsmE family RNA methyltransferase [Candidatus Cloacimonadota bacterium]MDD3869005.1 RsmE family RNA methyltransferase [Candidatus Cloacimonadota bacterium]HNZ33432.1 RsmE family RNA methyltransferase [Candidatus Cloacimonas sp.]
MPSIYVPELSPDKRSITIAGEEYHHLVNVRRVKIGEIIKLNSGTGVIAEGKISELTKRSVVIELLELVEYPYPEKNFAIAFALLKNKHDELLIEKCTELGVSTFYPMITDFSVRIPSKNTVNRFRQIAVSAIKQCDNPWLPMINEPLPLTETIDKVLSERWDPVLCSEQKPPKRISNLSSNIKPCFIIGPEGGYSEKEFAFFIKKDILQISICPLITRAETAAIAAAAQFQLL